MGTWFLRLAALVVLALTPATNLASAPAVPPIDGPGRPSGAGALQGALVVVAAGDIACDSDPRASGSSCRYGDTADLVDGRGFDRVLTLGDNQYDTGAYQDFVDYFDPTWGVVKGSISPVPGNHEYAQDPSSTPSGYFTYFGSRVEGPDGLGYYSYDLGSCPRTPCWHLVALSSELCFAEGGCDRPSDPNDAGTGERMWAWLKADLAAHPNDEYPCTLAYWHHPLFSFSAQSGASPAVRPLWRLLDRADAEIVLNGHSHNYQRWRPQTPRGEASHDGIREFVVGTGGKSHYAFLDRPEPSNLHTAQSNAFGVLRLAWGTGGYGWRWVGASGEPSFEDASQRVWRCH